MSPTRRNSSSRAKAPAPGPDPDGAAAEYLPPRLSLASLRRAAAGCRACHLWTCGTQTVFGEGPRQAPLMIVGEQPGDVEDQENRVFVGPAGRLLDRCLESAGIVRSDAYLTNAVKHFKWERSAHGSKRVHKTPNRAEVSACSPWLAAELRVVKPRVLLCLGATAAQAVFGASFRVTERRGTLVPLEGVDAAYATVHPSSVLRAPDSAARAEAERLLVRDLKRVAKRLAAGDANA